MTTPSIVLMGQRRYEAIPVDKIKVINSRMRDEQQFEMNVESIEHTGLLMPIRVNDKFLARSGLYELICGEGRLIAHQRLGKDTVTAEVVTCTRKEAYLQSLIENIARTKPGTMDFAREVKRLHDEGWDFARIARICVKSAEYIRQYIRLVNQGEERLIRGVEAGVFSISFAVLVASSDDASVQNVLMDAFDQGIVNASNFAQARRIINARIERRKNNGHVNGKEPLTVSMLQKDISEMTQAKDSFVREAKAKENRFLGLMVGINELWRDAELRSLLSEEGLTGRPELSGDYAYETSTENEG